MHTDSTAVDWMKGSFGSRSKANTGTDQGHEDWIPSLAESDLKQDPEWHSLEMLEMNQNASVQVARAI